LGLKRDRLGILGLKQASLNTTILEHHEARIVGLAHHTIRIKNIHEQIVDIAGSAIQVRSHLMALALELVAFGALVFEYLPTPFERPSTLQKRSSHSSDECVQLGRRVLTDLTPDRFDLTVQLLVAQGTQTED